MFRSRCWGVTTCESVSRARLPTMAPAIKRQSLGGNIRTDSTFTNEHDVHPWSVSDHLSRLRSSPSPSLHFHILHILIRLASRSKPRCLAIMINGKIKPKLGFKTELMRC